MKILTLITFFLLSTFINAQEKQNDATIDETINWINEYGSKNMVDFKKSMRKPYDFEIDDNTVQYTYDTGNNVDDRKNIIFIENQITDLIAQVSDGHYSISVRGDSGKIPIGFFYFGSNKEYTLKTYKAFEHLFYLLNWQVKCKNKLVDENKF